MEALLIEMTGVSAENGFDTFRDADGLRALRIHL